MALSPFVARAMNGTVVIICQFLCALGVFILRILLIEDIVLTIVFMSFCELVEGFLGLGFLIHISLLFTIRIRL